MVNEFSAYLHPTCSSTYKLLRIPILHGYSSCILLARIHILYCFFTGVCSFMWVDDYSSESDLFKVKCSPLKVGWRDMPQRIIDIGVLGKWWWIEKAMVDYDIHEEDWEDQITTKQINTNSVVTEIVR